MTHLPARSTEERPQALDRLPSTVRAPRTDAIYNCHAYLTKVPVAAIKPFIEAFTEPGETVVDMFAGSGMTGLAAASLRRIARMSDISVLGQHIARGYLLHTSPSAVRRAAEQAIDRAREDACDPYQSVRVSDGVKVEAVRTIWSFVYACPDCRHSLTYFDHLDDAGKPRGQCPSCGAAFDRRSWPRRDDRPMRVVVPGEDGKQIEQDVQPWDLSQIERARHDPRQGEVPSMSISTDREMFGRSGLRRAGVTGTRDFFSGRNGLSLLALWRRINDVGDSKVQQKLRFAFTASLTRASRRYQWGPKRPLNAQNQTYYVAPVYLEWNVFDLFQRKVEAVLRSDDLLFGDAPLFVGNIAERATYELSSADSLTHLADESTDYVFTDPPFGSNIFYSDMNLFHEAWLGQTTDDACEAVLHTSGPRKVGAFERYERILKGAFAEAFRVLKPGRFMSVVFGNSSGALWALVQRSFREVGFSEPLHVAILDKGQRSVKGLSSGSEGVVTVDLVLTVQKPAAARAGGRPHLERGDADLGDILAAAASHLAPHGNARNPSHIYGATLREAIRRRLSLEGIHYSDVLIALRNLGLGLDARTGLLNRPLTPSTFDEA